MVIALDRSVERWAAEILANVIPAAGRAFVLGPTTTRRITDPGLARVDPEGALLSALIHAGKPDDVDLIPAFAEALSTLDLARGRLIHDRMYRRLTAAAWTLLEAQMDLKDYVWTSPFALKHQAQGRAEGGREQLVQAILAVLDVRGIACTDEARARLDACTDTATLELWHRRAVTAATLGDVLAVE